MIENFFEHSPYGSRTTDNARDAHAAIEGEDHKYHDKGHNDEHAWNNHEDKAYRIWAKEIIGST